MPRTYPHPDLSPDGHLWLVDDPGDGEDITRTPKGHIDDLDYDQWPQACWVALRWAEAVHHDRMTGRSLAEELRINHMKAALGLA